MYTCNTRLFSLQYRLLSFDDLTTRTTLLHTHTVCALVKLPMQHLPTSDWTGDGRESPMSWLLLTVGLLAHGCTAFGWCAYGGALPRRLLPGAPRVTAAAASLGAPPPSAQSTAQSIAKESVRFDRSNLLRRVEKRRVRAEGGAHRFGRTPVERLELAHALGRAITSGPAAPPDPLGHVGARAAVGARA